MNPVARNLKRSSIILLIIESVALLVVSISLSFSDTEPIVWGCIFGGGFLIILMKYSILVGFATIIDLLDKIEKNTHNGKDYSSNESKKEMNKKQYKHNKAKRTYEEDEEDEDDDEEYTKMICPICGYDLYFTSEEKDFICPHCGNKMKN